MKSVSLASKGRLREPYKPGLFHGLAYRLVTRQLSRLEHGHLRLVDGEKVLQFGQRREQAALCADIHVLNPAFYADVAFGGSIGAGEAYMQGAWQCDDMVELVRMLVRNRHVLEGMERGAARLTRPLQKLFHWANRNTRSGARRNIAAHYDLGNDFFALWLDESMMYSSAMFARADMTLAEAQRHRLDVICRKLQLGPNDHVMEIGTGWGGFALHAAREYGCRVTTTTISREQHRLAGERIRAAGLGDRVTLLQDDYRDLGGQYDKLVSIEMIEAIGAEQFDTYFAKCSDLLKPGGRMLIQAITIADRQYEAYRRGVDFIQRYIFPGGLLPALSVMTGSIARATGLLVTSVEDIGLDYART
ncbi:MAG: cyclopropane-fatty-acyl-phospholipid synthase family protein, partial [Lysobacterales bacterium]